MTSQPGQSETRASAPRTQPFLGPWQAAILLMVLLTLLAVVILGLAKFGTSSDVVAFLGVILSPIVSIAAAAFGVSIAAEKAGQAGAAEGDAIARAANAEARRAGQQKAAAAEELDHMDSDLEALLRKIEQVGLSSIGSGRYSLEMIDAGGQKHSAEIPHELVAGIRQRVTRARQILSGP